MKKGMNYLQMQQQEIPDIPKIFSKCSAVFYYPLFLSEPVKLDPRLAVAKIFMIFRVYCYYFSHLILIPRYSNDL